MNKPYSIDFNKLHIHVKSVLEEIDTFCTKKNLPHPQVIGASKKRVAEEIKAAQTAGLRHFGENYVQEATAKHTQEAYISATLHLIGHLQSNKAKEAVALFDVFHGLDSPKLANALQKACMKENKKLEIFIQVNLAAEIQKGGISPENLPALIQHVQENCPNLTLTGLMTLPPASEAPTPYFRQLANLAKQHNLPHLSMGMSGDWQEALLCGATHIRLGTALFGPRPTA